MAGEHFRKSYRQDCLAVRELGTTHIEIANHLGSLMDNLLSSSSREENRPYRNIFYDPSQLPSSTIGKRSGKQTIQVDTPSGTHLIDKEAQDIFQRMEC